MKLISLCSMDHTVYDCNSRDFSKAGKIPGDYDTVRDPNDLTLAPDAK